MKARQDKLFSCSENILSTLIKVNLISKQILCSHTDGHKLIKIISDYTQKPNRI